MPRTYLLPLLFVIGFVTLGCQEDKIPTPKPKALQQEIKPQVSEKIETTILEAEVQPNQGLFQVLEELKIPQQHALELINKLRFEVDLTTLRVGQKLRTEWFPDSSRVKFIEFQPNVITTYRLDWNTDSSNYIFSELEKPTEKKIRMLEGELKSGSTVDQILNANDIPRYLVQTINGVLLCKVSFRSEAQPGDKFRALIEEEYYEGEVVRGKVLYTSYEGRVAGFHEAYRYEDPKDPKSSFNAHYTPEGEALVASGLRYPVDRLHISSSYGMRRHPVTGKRRMHAGVDYAARTGTPVYAVAPGKVVISSYDQYSGNKVAIRHADKSTSYYLHLSKRLVRNGQEVRSRQLIGRVGATGRVTGPHLHFGFKKPNGQWMNPSRKRMIATPKLAGDRLKELTKQISEVKIKKSSAPIVEAKHPLPAWPEDVPFLWFEEEDPEV